MGKENVPVRVLLHVLSIMFFQFHAASVPYLIKIEIPLREVKVTL